MKEEIKKQLIKNSGKITEDVVVCDGDTAIDITDLVQDYVAAAKEYAYDKAAGIAENHNEATRVIAEEIRSLKVKEGK